MILEGIVTTLNPNGELNVAPMGPHVTPEMDFFELKPFATSTTHFNLVPSGEGVLHVTDDVFLFAQTAIGTSDVETTTAESVEGRVIPRACRAYEFKVEYMDLTQPRAVFKCRTLAVHRFRDFFGFNRAKHAVIEAAILATRVSFLPPDEVSAEFARLASLVRKTGGDREQAAFEFLQQYVKSDELA